MGKPTEPVTHYGEVHTGDAWDPTSVASTCRTCLLLLYFLVTSQILIYTGHWKLLHYASPYRVSMSPLEQG